MILAKSNKHILQRKISIQMAVLLTRSSRLCLFAGNEAVFIRALCAEFGALSISAASSLSMSSPMNPNENAVDMSAPFSLYIRVSRRASRIANEGLSQNEWRQKLPRKFEVFHPNLLVSAPRPLGFRLRSSPQ